MTRVLSLANPQGLAWPPAATQEGFEAALHAEGGLAVAASAVGLVVRM